MNFTRRTFGLVIIAGVAGPSLTQGAAAQSAGTLEEAKKRGALRVGVTQAPPWFSKDTRSGEWSGVGAAMGRQMAQTLGVAFEPVEVTWGTAIAALQAGKIDLMAVLDATPERKQAVDFPTNPLLYYSLAVLAKDDLPVKAWSDLDKPDVRIAVPQATSMDKFLTESVSKAAIQRFPGNAEAIAAFQAGRVEAVCLFHPPLLAARQKLGTGKIVVPTPTKSNPSSVAVRKGDDAFRDWVDARLGEYYKSRQIQTWYEEFLKAYGLDPKAAPPIVKEMLG